MRLYCVVLLVSNTLPARVTGTSGVPYSLVTGENSTDSVSPFVDDSADAINDEERAPRPDLSKILPFLPGTQKTTQFKVPGGVSKSKSISGPQRRRMSKGLEMLRRVQVPAGVNTKQQMNRLRARVRDTEGGDGKLTKLYAPTSRTKKWLEKANKNDIMTTLNYHHFFLYFSFKKVKALEEYFGPSETDKFLETLSEGFKGMVNFAFYLSIAKQSPIFGKDAALLQKKLLTYWQASSVTVKDVMIYLDLKNRGLTCEILDTLVEFVAVCTNKKPNEVYAETIQHLKKKFTDLQLEQMITKAKKEVVPSTASHLREKDEANNIAPEEVEHIDLLKGLETELLRV